MQNLIWFSWIIGTLVVFAAQPRYGGLVYLAAAMLAPYGVFSGGLVVRADLILPPLMLACQFLGVSRTTARFSLIPIVWLFALWLLWIALATIVSDNDVNLVGAYGYIRLVLVMTVFSWIPWRQSDVDEYQFVYVLTSIPIGLLCMGQLLNVSVLRSLAEGWYSPPNAVVMAMQADAEQSGRLYRAVGVFGNVSPTATYFLVAICLAISLYSSAAMTTRRRWLGLALATSVGGGVATLSATFVGGFAAAVFVAILNAGSRQRRRLIWGSIGCFVALAVVVTIARSRIETLDEHFHYQWERLCNGQFLSERYSSDEGVLADAIQAIEERPFLGSGWTHTGVFCGDSIYFNLLYDGGIIGCIPLVAGLVRLTHAAGRNKRIGHWALSWTAVMLIGGVGCTSLLSGRLADGWWAMQGILVSQLAAAPRRQLIARLHRGNSTVSVTARAIKKDTCVTPSFAPLQ